MDLYLVIVCALAIVAVMGLLGFLAAAMHIITRVFPVRRDGLDPAIAGAIGAVVAAKYPGARVTRIEEEKQRS